MTFKDRIVDTIRMNIYQYVLLWLSALSSSMNYPLLPMYKGKKQLSTQYIFSKRRGPTNPCMDGFNCSLTQAEKKGLVHPLASSLNWDCF